ncbi:hypothetical protein SAMN02745218_03009 [Desulfofundulus australicus DSM 11792]|uniref:Uncharacterized protein n=1 Tax=Desulfofundulus australicus DSM 11792 TaxID=1121425 RepID=A0A1M5E8T7_9FIRM|nr:hypothetical protein SAMN02745218_03009 [Desulfofundulus australicus DSM 11792]
MPAILPVINFGSRHLFAYCQGIPPPLAWVLGVCCLTVGYA